MKAFLAPFTFFFLFIGIAAPAQKNKKATNDSLARLDSVRTYTLQASLLSMNAMQAKIESQKPDGKGGTVTNPQKAGEAQNLFVQSRYYYRKAIAFDPNYYLAWSNLGTTYYFEGLPKVAIPYFVKAVQINPQYSQGWFNLGKTYDLIGKKDSAVYALKQSIRSDSTYVQPYAELAKIYAGSKDSAAALGLLRTAISYKPESEFLWKNMATTCLSFGDSTGWVSALEKAAKINPNDVQRLYLLADYFSRKKDVTKAAYYANLEAEALERQNIPREEEK